MKQLTKSLFFWYYAAAIKAVIMAALGYACVTQNWFEMAKDAPASVTIYSIIKDHTGINTIDGLKGLFVKNEIS